MNVYYVTMLVVIVAGCAARPLLRPGPVTGEVLSTARARPNAWLAFFAGAVLTLVGALRWRVGTDYETYAANFHDYATVPARSYTLLSEPGIRLLARLSYLVRDDYAVMFAAAAAIITGLSVWTMYRQSQAFALSLWLFMLTGPWLGAFNAVRQYLACAVMFAGHHFILQRKFVQYLLVVVAAGLFHGSAFLLVFLYFVPRRRLSLVTSTTAIVAAVLATSAYGWFLEFIVVFREDTDFGLAGSYFAEEVSPLRIAAAFAPLIFYMFVTSKKALGPDDNFYVHMLLLNATILLAASGSAYIARMYLYTGVFLCLAIPRLLPTHPNLRTAALLVILPLYLVFWYAETSNISALSNFQWIFNRPEGR